MTTKEITTSPQSVGEAQPMPLPPDSLKPLLSSKYRSSEDVTDYWTAPTRVTMSQVMDAKKFVNEMIKISLPANKKWLSDRLESFLAHYFTAAAGEKLNAMVAHDWMQMLQDFPATCIDRAVTHWIKTEKRRPKIAEIRELSISYFGLRNWLNLERARIIAQIFPTADEPTRDGKPKEDKWTPPTEEQKRSVADLLKDITAKAMNTPKGDQP